MITYYKVNHKNVLDYASFPTFVLCSVGIVLCIVLLCGVCCVVLLYVV